MKVKDKVIWKNWNCIVSKVKLRWGIVKIKPDYKSGQTMPYPYFWVDNIELQ
ncbi:MAG: hypothetical protein KA234_00540 [Saprospiraceae bacterium]|nr:hypothetical protein [Saprospiraceae bacterium]